MKKILIINPNTSPEMTNDIRSTIEHIKDENIDTVTICPDFGSPSLEYFYDYNLASFAVIRLLNKLNKSGQHFDGILISCFGDPGLYAIKEISNVPVIGIAEASMAVSLLMGQKFSLLVASKKAVPMMKDMVNQYGLTSRLASIESMNANVLDVEQDKQKFINKSILIGEKAIAKGAEVLILGCAGMTNMQTKIKEALNIPVIDPVVYGYKTLEMMVENNFPISKIGLYKTPYSKKILKENLLYM